jgi:hypothetical protein
MKKKIIFFASLKSLKKGVGAGSGSLSQRLRVRGSGSGSAPKCHGSPTPVSSGLVWSLYSGVLLPDPDYGVEEEDGVGGGVGVGVGGGVGAGGGGGVGHHPPGGRFHGSAGTAAPSTTVMVDKR